MPLVRRDSSPQGHRCQHLPRHPSGRCCSARTPACRTGRSASRARAARSSAPRTRRRCCGAPHAPARRDHRSPRARASKARRSCRDRSRRLPDRARRASEPRSRQSGTSRAACSGRSRPRSRSRSTRWRGSGSPQSLTRGSGHDYASHLLCEEKLSERFVFPRTNTGETRGGSFRAVKSLEEALERARAGGPERHREKSVQQGKLPVRERIDRLVDPGTFAEEALLANWESDGFGADGVVTGMAKIGGRPACVMANDPTVKAGSWGPKTVEKINRIQEQALKHLVPMIYLVDSAGARITDQVQMFPGRRGAGRIFHTQVKLSGVVPQVCVLFGPSAAGGAYIPSFCDVVVIRDGNASMYLGSPRMAEMVIGEKVSLEEMGGARMHTGVS